jgi:hypothetical protein
MNTDVFSSTGTTAMGLVATFLHLAFAAAQLLAASASPRRRRAPAWQPTPPPAAPRAA